MSESFLLDQTICSQEAEKACHEALKKFLSQFINFYDEIQTFFEYEKTILQKLWQYSIKLKILRRTDPPSYYPEEVAQYVRSSVLQDLTTNMRQHFIKLSDSQKEFKEAQGLYKNLQSAALKLENDQNLEIFKGNPHQRPLEYYLNEGERNLSHAGMILDQLHTNFDKIVIEETVTFENYKKAFDIAVDFVNLLKEFYVYSRVFIKYCDGET